MKRFGAYVWSLDTGIAVVAAIVLLCKLPLAVSSAFAKDVYAVGISALSIVFSVFFAALANIIASSDDQFVQWLVQRGHYRVLIGLCKFTLGSLFVALVASLVLYVGTSQYVQALGEQARQSRWWLVVFSALFAHALVATAQSVMGAIGYAERRAEFICPLEGDNSPQKEEVPQGQTQ